MTTAAQWAAIALLVVAGCTERGPGPFAEFDAAEHDAAVDGVASDGAGDAGASGDAATDGAGDGGVWPEAGAPRVCAALEPPPASIGRDGASSGPDLRDADLRCTDLRGARLAGADLTGVDLTGSDLTGADLTGAFLRGASLLGAHLARATLRGANLAFANLTGADLDGADLTGADLTSLRAPDLLSCPASLPDRWKCALRRDTARYVLAGPGADLFYVDLAGADLDGADLEGADLEGATLDGVRGTNLVRCPERLPEPWKCIASSTSGAFLMAGPRADLARADLSGYSLVDANLADVHAVDLLGCPATLPDGWRCFTRPATGRGVLIGAGADLVGADLAGVDLTGVDLSGTDLAGADLSGTTLVGARGFELRSCPAALPPRFSCVALWQLALVGPAMNLSGGSLSGDLSHQDLTGADLTDASLQGADLSSTVLTGARLAGASAFHLVACPAALPGPGWICVAETPSGFALVGPSVVLESVDLTGADLSAADLTGVRACFPAPYPGLRREDYCPARLPPSWQCVEGMPTWPTCWTLLFIGPGADLHEAYLGTATLAGVDLHGANLRDADLDSADLRGADLSGADLTGARFGGVPRAWDLLGCPAELPRTGFACIAQQAPGRFMLIGPDMALPPDLTGLDLTGVDLAHTFQSVLPGCPARLPSRWVCAAVPGGFVLAGPGVFLAQFNLSGIDLSGVDLTDAYLVGANLSGATLTGTNLTRVQLNKADLTGATLTGASWVGTTCPDGTNSNQNGSTCVGHLTAMQ